jgi:hypothetical protein
VLGAEINRRLEVIQNMPFGGTSPQINAHGFVLTAAETAGGTTGNWYVSVRAICAANPVAGHQIVTSSTGFSSASSQAAQADCPGGKSAIGTGAAINFAPGQAAIGVGFQVKRTRGSGGSTLAQAHEQASGYAFNWQLVDYAICATTPLGYEIRANDTTGVGSVASCTGTKQILDAGAVSDATYSVAIPFDTTDDASVLAGRNPTTGFISAYAICATTTPR